MNRIKDYASFATWFVGLGYIALWPLASPELNGRPFGASIFCRDNSLSALDLLCDLAHSLPLPSGLHALGFTAAAFVTIRLLIYAIRRFRRAVGGAGVETVASVAATPRTQAAIAFVPKPSRRKAPPPLRAVKPRNHFGLRGMPR